ncbi:MAG: hypothetical protein AB7E83_14890 [Ramlibacter sp.]
MGSRLVIFRGKWTTCPPVLRPTVTTYMLGYPWISTDIPTMKQKRKKVLLSIPEALLRKIDAAAKAQERDRSSEVSLRLQASLKEKNPLRLAA